jgi:hypothetical protein
MVTIKAAVCTISGVALIVSGTTGLLAHEINGVQSYYACQPTRARAFLRSPNPGAGNQDYPLVVLDRAGNPTGERIVVITVQNASDLDARLTAVGFAWAGAAGTFELVELFRSYNQLTTNVGGVRTGTIGPNDYAVVPSTVISQSHGLVEFSVRQDVQGIPLFPLTRLNVALVTGLTFAGGQPAGGLASDGVRHVIAIKGFLPPPAQGVPDIEGLLNFSYVRFRQIGLFGDEADTGIWRELLPSISCP